MAMNYLYNYTICALKDSHSNYIICCLYLLRSVFHKRRSITKSHDGVFSFHQPYIYICCERIVLFLRNMFKFPGHTQLPEVCTTSK
jgi:hypothetical protein